MEQIFQVIQRKAWQKYFSTKVLPKIRDTQYKAICLDKVPAVMSEHLYYTVYFIDYEVASSGGDLWLDVSRYDVLERKRLFYELRKKKQYKVCAVRKGGACYIRVIEGLPTLR